MSIAEQLIVKDNYFYDDTFVVKSLTVQVKASVPDPIHVHSRIESPLTKLTVTPKMTLKNFITQFKVTNSEFSKCKNMYVKFRNRLFSPDAGFTLEQCGIKNNDYLELTSLSDEKSAISNQGFMLSYWSAVPLMIGISFLVSAVSGTFDIYIRGSFFLIGSIMGIPSLVCFIIGLAEVFPSWFSVAFVNTWWFGYSCCCSHQDEDDEELLIDNEDDVLLGKKEDEGLKKKINELKLDDL